MKVIGIDVGVNTGISIWDTEQKRLTMCESGMVHQALSLVEFMFRKDSDLYVRVEDARKRKWIPKDRGREVLQGAGSVKRDSKIWEDFLTDLKIPHEMVAPKNNRTKMKADYFSKVTGYTGKTNEHARDSAMLCFQFKLINKQTKN
jgi:hypothetical protein